MNVVRMLWKCCANVVRKLWRCYADSVLIMMRIPCSILQLLSSTPPETTVQPSLDGAMVGWGTCITSLGNAVAVYHEIQYSLSHSNPKPRFAKSTCGTRR